MKNPSDSDSLNKAFAPQAHEYYPQEHAKPQNYPQSYHDNNLQYQPVNSQYQPVNPQYQPYIPPNQIQPYQYQQNYVPSQPSYIPFDVLPVQVQSHNSFEEVQAKIRKLNAKFDYPEFSCYRHIMLIFAIFTGLAALGNVFLFLSSSKDEIFYAFADLACRAVECYQFSMGYTAVIKRHLGSAKIAVAFMKWFMIAYGVVYLIIAFTKDSTNSFGDRNDHNENNVSNGDTQKITAILLTEIVMAIVLHRTMKVRKILDKMKKLKENMPPML